MENCCLITLIKKLRKHETAAFSQIFSEFEKLIGYYAFRLGGEDAFQELSVFLLELLYKINFSPFEKDVDDSLKRYIAVCIRNKYIAYSKESRKDRNTLSVFFYNCPQSEFEFMDNQALKEAISLLSKRQRDIVIYKYIYDYSDVEISDFLGISRQAVNRLKNRAMEKLREYYV